MRTIQFSSVLVLLLALCSACRKPVVGCMEAAYSNYDVEANEDDGCCCTIVSGPQDGTGTGATFSLAFPNAPDTLTPMHTITLRANVGRIDQTAEGPCGCLYMPLGREQIEPGSYSSAERTYGPHTLLYTYIGWSATPSPDPIDSADWNIIAAANGFGSSVSSMLVHYNIRFTAAGSDELVMQFTDTLKAFDDSNTSSSDPRVYLDWGRGIPTHRISDEDIPFAIYPIVNGSVTIDLLSISFLP